MICIRCGLTKRGNRDFFVCDDCEDFGKVVKTVYDDVEEKLKSYETIDPETNQIFRLLADSSFITSQNPQTKIFYNICALLVEKALQGEYEITETELNRKIRTTRGWTDAFKIFEELDLIEVKLRGYDRILIIKDKLKKFAEQYQTGEPLTKQLTTRFAHIYSGYVLFHILQQIADLDEDSDPKTLPYGQRPRTLWVILMYLWSKAYNDNKKFDDEDMRMFISKRRIPSTTRGHIMQSLEYVSGKTTQGLIKDISFKGENKIFTFDDYVMIEMDRLRTIIRERER